MKHGTTVLVEEELTKTVLEQRLGLRTAVAAVAMPQPLAAYK